MFCKPIKKKCRQKKNLWLAFRKSAVVSQNLNLCQNPLSETIEELELYSCKIHLTLLTASDMRTVRITIRSEVDGSEVNIKSKSNQINQIMFIISFLFLQSFLLKLVILPGPFYDLNYCYYWLYRQLFLGVKWTL